jgi:methylmalonyl-CoA mutase, C-terminal domain
MSIAIRVLVAKPGLDGHDRCAKVTSSTLRNSGIAAIYTGLRRTPEMAINAALRKDVQAIEPSTLSGAHKAIVPRLIGLLSEKETNDMRVVVVGDTPDDDAAKLKQSDVAEMFQLDAYLEKIVPFIRDSVKQVA